jgi:hypothetical protein
MSRIFISYRRDDSAADMTDRLYERLHGYWGRRVFMDLDSLVGGDLFEKTIEENLRTCGVMLVIIGRHWASLTNEQGLRRIDDPRDYPRMEVAAALKRGVRIIPVLVGNAPLPKREELPQDIVGLLDRQYVRVSRERFSADVQHLIEAVALEMPRRSWWQLPWQALAGAAAALALAATAYFAIVGNDAPRDRAIDSPTDSSSAKGEASVSGESHKAAAKEEPIGTAGAAVDSSARAKTDVDKPVGLVNVSGKWKTALITSAYGSPSFILWFEFTQVDDKVLGTTIEADEGRSYAQGVSRAIIEGRVKNNVISFHTKGEDTQGPYKQMYVGTIQKGGREIAFRRYNDVVSGGATEAFVAFRGRITPER